MLLKDGEPQFGSEFVAVQTIKVCTVGFKLPQGPPISSSSPQHRVGRPSEAVAWRVTSHAAAIAVRHAGCAEPAPHPGTQEFRKQPRTEAVEKQSPVWP